MGRIVARALQSEQIDFYGFCGRDVEKFPDGILGKPVLSPDELVAHGGEYYVLITVVTKRAYTEIFQFLKEHHYPSSHILDWSDAISYSDEEKQYFEFPELYHRGTAFIDGGCYDCGSSYRFAEWCGGEYSSIIAFEPDPDNYAKCCKKVRDAPLPNFQLVNAGLASQEGTVVFISDNNLSESHISFAELPAESNIRKPESNIDKIESKNEISIRTVAIDDIVGDHTVGLIKMDIEGAEFDTLHGAKDTILRDKPLLAISVYHLQGDVFAIMDYLHQLLPEYRFLLRHYGVKLTFETVLYASVDL